MEKALLLAKGLSGGREPSLRIRSTFPALLSFLCELAGFAASPVTAYSFPSGPKWMTPPLWFPAAGTVARRLTVTPPPASLRIRTIRFCSGLACV